MKFFENSNSESEIFLGVDGGQSHTEAVVADGRGRILGRGTGGASNHAEIPGGRERLRKAILDSVGGALRGAQRAADGETRFKSAHFGMTGGAAYKEAIIGEIVEAEHLTVGHDAPTALFGATAGKPGIVVIAGTGSVVYGENQTGASARVGGLGYLFSDEGSGFWLAAQTVRLAIKEQDGLIEPAGLERLVLDFFGRAHLRDLTDDFYNGKLTRDELARLAQAAADAADGGNRALQNQIAFGADVLVEGIGASARRLNFAGEFPVAGGGGMFRGAFFKKHFAVRLQTEIPRARFVEPRFGPAVGALLVAYRQAGVAVGENLLINLEKSAQMRAQQKTSNENE